MKPLEEKKTIENSLDKAIKGRKQSRQYEKTAEGHKDKKKTEDYFDTDDQRLDWFQPSV